MFGGERREKERDIHPIQPIMQRARTTMPRERDRGISEHRRLRGVNGRQGASAAGQLVGYGMPDARQHYHFLDFCRGVAALIVLVYHLGPVVGGGNYLESGFLAVDFFFILSGFVIAHAYEKRLRTTMTVAEFCRARVIRLYPMAVLGVLVGYAALLAAWALAPDASKDLGDLHASLAANILLLPKFWTSEAGNGELFPLDGALWSLFFELTLNILFALFIARLRDWAVAALAVLGAVMALAIAFHVGTFNIGWNQDIALGGFARCLFGFSAGVLIFRHRHIFAFRWNAAGFVVLAILCLFPFFGDRNLIASAVAILVFFPAIVALGTNVNWKSALWLQKLSGNLSYPLYTLHLPIIGIAALAHQQLFPELSTSIFQPVLMAGIVVASYLSFYYLDVPVRRFLNRPRQEEAGRSRFDHGIQAR
jgi:peptidoglycan/LPS O-acetylase OafA/YrhL